MSIRIRRIGDERDLDLILPLAHQAFEESRYAHLPFSGERLRHALRELFRLGPDAVLAVAERQDNKGEKKAAGAMIASIGPLRFTDLRVARCQFLYVERQHRISSLASDLISEFKGWSKERAAADMVISVTMGNDNDRRVVEFLRRKGFREAGENLVKPLAGAA